ncbi:hypothetical protein PI124_g2049 [Phytophthora idaei]|nr:hypothetical protein PI124_g2049 [Phytophthora idaei]
MRKCIFPDGWLAIDVLRGPVVHAVYVTVVIVQLEITGTEFQQKITNLQDGNFSGDEALTPLIDALKYIARL